MIYTVTLNPSIDYVITLDALCKGAINRTKEEDIIYGGKGINVSMMLAHLGIPSTALGFFAGFKMCIRDSNIRCMIKYVQ